MQREEEIKTKFSNPGNPDESATRWSSNSDTANNNNTRNSVNNNNNPSRGVEETQPTNKMTINDIDPEVEATSSGRTRPRVEIEETAQDGFSGSYPQLKKWALPGW